MRGKEEKSLVSRPSGELARIPSAASAIIEGMVNDAADIIHARETIRHKVGNYEFREPDYRQVLIWAEAAGVTPDDLVMRLQKGRLKVSDGAFIGIGVQHVFMGIGLDLSQVPQLKKLDCRKNKLTELDLSRVPQLETLDCGRNRLTELDLSQVSQLKELGCRRNELAELDLSWSPQLKELNCMSNVLSKLDLSRVAGLKGLRCGNNHLTELDLSRVPNLKVLSCGYNELTELDLSRVPQLETLGCWGNELTELDLSGVSYLKELDCTGNALAELNISGLKEREPRVRCDPDVRIHQRDDQNPTIFRHERSF